MSDTDETDSIVFFKNLLEDQTIIDLIKEINKMREECGDNGDDFISFLIGSIAHLFSEPENAIACLEAVKFGILLKGISSSTSFISDELRKKEPEKMRPV